MPRFYQEPINWRSQRDDAACEGQLQKPVKIFAITRATTEAPAPFYIYNFDFYKTRDQSQAEAAAGARVGPANEIATATKLPEKIRTAVIAKALNSWLDEHQPEHPLYFINMHRYLLISQFPFLESTSTDSAAVGLGGGLWSGRNGCPNLGRLERFEQQVILAEPKIVDSEVVSVEESYDFVLERYLPPVEDLTKIQTNKLICSALNSLVLEDVEKDENFASTRSGCVYNLTDAKHKRMSKLGSCLTHCHGLHVSLVFTPSPHSWRLSPTLLKIQESSGLFFEPMNVVELISKHFGYDVKAELNEAQIACLKRDLIGQLVEMRRIPAGIPTDKGEQYYGTCVKDICETSMAKDPCDFSDWRTGELVSGITVEMYFKREFPDVQLAYTNLPCLISPQGRRMPMEVCWIEPFRVVDRQPTREEMYFSRKSPGERAKIFEENCADLVERHGQTLRKFGYQLTEHHSR